MSPPEIALVSAPSPSATLLYRFNVEDGRRAAAHSGFDLGAPVWRGEPGVVGGSDDYRTIRFTHWLTPRSGDPDSVLQTALDTLGRLLLSRTCWLLIRQRPTSAPVWARLWRSSPGPLSFEDLRIDTAISGRYGIPLEFRADPYLVGEQQSLASSITVNFDPAAGSNPCLYTLPAVVGDAPAPAVVQLAWSNNRHGYRHFVSSSSAAPTFHQLGTGDGMTIDADTTIVSNPSFSNGSTRSTSFAAVATMLDRITGNGPALAPGAYKVFALCWRSDTATQFNIRFGQKVQLSYAYQPTRQVPWVSGGASGHGAWIEVATLLDIPQGTGVDLSAESGTVTPDIAIGLQRTSGSGAVRVDALAFVPVRDSLYVDHPDIGPGDSFLFREVHDGELEPEALYVRQAIGGALVPSQAAAVEGGYLTVVPGAGNTITMLGQTHPVRVSNFWQNCPYVITHTARLFVTYRPLWLWPRP